MSVDRITATVANFANIATATNFKIAQNHRILKQCQNKFLIINYFP